MEDTDDPASELITLLHGEASLKDPPDGGKMRQPDSQTKPWEALGISRATWYRQGKPDRNGSNYYFRQKNQAKMNLRSVRTIQRVAFIRRYGIPELKHLVLEDFFLQPGVVAEIAYWPHDDQHWFLNRFIELIDSIPDLKVDASFVEGIGSLVAGKIHAAEKAVGRTQLRRFAKQAFAETVSRMLAALASELSKEPR